MQSWPPSCESRPVRPANILQFKYFQSSDSTTTSGQNAGGRDLVTDSPRNPGEKRRSFLPTGSSFLKASPFWSVSVAPGVAPSDACASTLALVDKITEELLVALQKRSSCMSVHHRYSVRKNIPRYTLD